MSCKCENRLEALGLPSCAFLPERIRRFIFTPDLVRSQDPASGITALGTPFPDPPFSPGVLWRDMWRLITPRLDLVESERGDPVLETVGENQYFVRNSLRGFRGLVAKVPAEFDRLISQLRCQATLGVFMVDANGVIWGMRAPGYEHYDVMPIPVVPSSISGRQIYASAESVFKYEFRFEASVEFGDKDLVPIWEAKAVLNYEPPMGVLGTGYFDGSGNLQISVYSLFARGPMVGGEIAIPHLDIESYLEVRRMDGTPITGVTWTELGGGQYEAAGIPGSINAVQVVIPQTQWTTIWTNTNRRFDWPNFRVVVRR